MTMREKLLEALEFDPELMTDEQLLALLLDAHARRQQRINELERERAGQQLAHQRSMEALQEEHHRMRSDPLYGAAGNYFFCHEWSKWATGLESLQAEHYKQQFVVRVAGRSIEMCERKQGYDMAIQQVSREEFLK